MIAESKNWQQFKALLTLNGVEENNAEEVINKIRLGFIVDEIPKIKLE